MNATLRCLLVSRYIDRRLSRAFNDISGEYTETRRRSFLIHLFAPSCFSVDLPGTSGFLYEHSTSINVFVIKRRPGHVTGPTSQDGAVGMDVAWQGTASHRLPSFRCLCPAVLC